MLFFPDSSNYAHTFSFHLNVMFLFIYSFQVAKHIGSEHHEVSFTAEEGIAALEEVIKSLESYDIITIRSSIRKLFLIKYVMHHNKRYL